MLVRYIIKVVLIAVLLVGCLGDPIYRLSVGPLRLPMADTLTYVLHTEGVPSVFPVLHQMKLRRLNQKTATEVVLFVTQKLPEPQRLKQLHPALLKKIQEASGLSVNQKGDVADLGRLACYATWVEGMTETNCAVPSIPVLTEGWLMYAIASPVPEWIEITLNFKRTGIAEAPKVSVVRVARSS